MPLVSIITPCHNAARFLPETIACILSQTEQDWEWIICDDASTDGSPEILSQIRDSRIRVILKKENGGAGDARNTALAQATGRYITFIDADDWWAPDFLAEMTGFMLQTGAELAYSNYARCNEDMEPVIADFQADVPVTFHNLLRTCRLSLLSSMYDSRRIGKVFFPVGTRREDHVMWLNVLQKIPQGLPLPKTMAKYRMHAQSVSRKKGTVVYDQYLVYREHMKYNLLKSGWYTALWAANGFRKYSKFFNKKKASV